MPRDYNGNLVQKGDIVVVAFEVTEAYEHGTACNLVLRATPREDVHAVLPHLTLNARLVDLVDSRAPAEPTTTTTTSGPPATTADEPAMEPETAAPA
jgi:hypothetical protein